MKEADWMKSKLKMPAGRANKNEDEYIDRIYKENKIVIESTVKDINRLTEGFRMGSGITDSRKWFKRTVKELMEDRNIKSVKEAIQVLGRSTDFLSQSERSLQNIVRAIRKDENFKRFRKMIRYEEIDWNKLKYDGIEGKSSVFIYGNLVIEAPSDSKYGHLNFYIR